MHPSRKASEAARCAKAEWPAIVSENLWRGVNVKLKAKSASAVGRGAQLLLTGVALCGVCVEEGIDGTVHGGGAVQPYRMYACARTHGHIRRRASTVDEYVSEYAIARLSRPDARELLSARPGQPGMAQLQADHKALTERKQAFASELEESLSPADYGRMIAEFDTRIRAVQDQMADDGRSAVLGPLIGAADPAALWKGMPVDHKRRVIDNLFTVTLLRSKPGLHTFDPDSVLIEPKRATRPAPKLKGGIKQKVGQKKDRSGGK